MVPTSPIARGHALAVWDPRDPHLSPQTTIFTAEMSPLSLAAFQEASGPVILSQNCQMTLFFSHSTSLVVRGHASAIWDPGDHNQSPQTTKFTPEASQPP